MDDFLTETPAPRGGTAVGYLRVSTGGQTDNTSLEFQRTQIENYCAAREITIIDWQIDVQSGAESERAGWQTAIDASHEAERVVVLRPDRASRDTVGLLNAIDQLEGVNRQLEAVELPISPHTSVGRFIWSIMAGFAELERVLIYERTQAGRESKQKTGGYVGGSPPIGFCAVAGQLVALPEEQSIIKAAKDLRCKGFSLQQIADAFTRRGFPTKRGGKWHKSIISKILKRE